MRFQHVHRDQIATGHRRTEIVQGRCTTPDILVVLQRHIRIDRMALRRIALFEFNLRIRKLEEPSKLPPVPW